MKQKKTKKIHDACADTKSQSRSDDPGTAVKMKGHAAGKGEKCGGGRKKLTDEEPPKVSGDAKAGDSKPDKKDADQQGESILPEGCDGFSHTI